VYYNVAVAAHAKIVETSIIILSRQCHDLEGIPRWLSLGCTGNASSSQRSQLPGRDGRLLGKK